MSRQMALPEECNEWMTDEIRALLREIRGRWAAKKRATVIKVAFALANEQPLAQVFRQDDVCSETIWYQKWRHQPAVRAAFDACYKRALEWADDETARLEAFYRRRRQRSIAEHAAEAPAQLADVMTTDDAGGNRIRAADTLMRWAEPDLAGKLQPTPEGGGDTVINQFLAGLSNDQLEQLLTGSDDSDGEGGAQGDDAGEGPG